MGPLGDGPAYADGQPDQVPGGDGGFCGSCGRPLPPPDLEGVASSIDQTLSLEEGRMIPRTAWAGRPPDGGVDALLSFLPSARARRRVWERGQSLWTEQMTAALSGPCDECQRLASTGAPAATLIQSPHEAASQPRPTTPLAGATFTTPSSAASELPHTSILPDVDEGGATEAMPAYSEPDSASASSADDAPTSAAPPFSASVGGATSADQPPGLSVPASDEHEAHTVILSALPNLRTATRLVVLEGPVHGRQFSLGRQLTTIGRSIGCHVTVEDDAVAYDHARVVRLDQEWRIESIGGSGEIYVNDEPIRDRRVLRHGDVIRIGSARLRFEMVS
jgi:hypothetical protein